MEAARLGRKQSVGNLIQLELHLEVSRLHAPTRHPCGPALTPTHVQGPPDERFPSLSHNKSESTASEGHAPACVLELEESMLFQGQHHFSVETCGAFGSAEFKISCHLILPTLVLL